MATEHPLSDAVIESTKREFGGVRFVRKTDSAFCKVIDAVLRVVTFGLMREFLTSYYTTIGQTIYVPAQHDTSSDVSRCIALRHERVHLRQWRELGYAGMAVTYLLPILPVGFAIGRAYLEQEAYEETLRAMVEYHGIDAVHDPIFREHIVSQFTGPAYGWMWPFRRVIEAWYDKFVARLEPWRFPHEGSDVRLP